jgi:hypothetical protein
MVPGEGVKTTENKKTLAPLDFLKEDYKTQSVSF